MRALTHIFCAPFLPGTHDYLSHCAAGMRSRKCKLVTFSSSLLVLYQDSSLRTQARTCTSFSHDHSAVVGMQNCAVSYGGM